MINFLYKKVKPPSQDGLSELINNLDSEYYDYFRNRNHQTNNTNSLFTTNEAIDNFFYQMSQLWENQDFQNLHQLFHINVLPKFNDAFIRFNIANLAVETFKKSDNPVFLIDILSFFLRLIKIDDQYAMHLLQTDFLDVLFCVYRDVKSSECSIRVLQCASEVAQISIEFRDNVYFISKIISSNAITENTADLNEIFILIRSFLSFEIDQSMFKAISDFLISKISIIISYLINFRKDQIPDEINENYDDQNKRKACQNYTFCLAILSYYPDWPQFFDENKEMMINLYIELLFSQDESILVNSAYALTQICQVMPIEDKKLAIAIVRLLFNNNSKVLIYSCDVFIQLVCHSNPNIFIEASKIIIDRLFELSQRQCYMLKVAVLNTFTYFLYKFPETLSYAISQGLFKIIDMMLDVEDKYFTLCAISILDCIFENEERRGINESLNNFIDREGMKQLYDLFTEEDIDQDIIDNVTLFLKKYDISIIED